MGNNFNNCDIAPGADAWIADSHTWVYVSSTSFKVVGLDVTAQFTKGTRISYNDGAVDYGVVASSAFAAGDTTITLIANDDYSIANTTLTAPRYSYQVNPQGYPGFFAYTPTLTGYSVNPTTSTYIYNVVGTQVNLEVRQGGNGTSNTTAKTITLPVSMSSRASNLQINAGFCVDNGSAIVTGMMALINVAAPTVVSVFPAFVNTSLWTASGGCRQTFQISYEM